MADDTNTVSAGDSCPACGGAGEDFLPAGLLPSKGEVRRCRNCGTAYFAARRPEPDYWRAGGQVETYAAAAVSDELLALHQTALDDLAARLPAGGMLLDAGCGDGVFLAAARARGWETAGVDSSQTAAELTGRRLGAQIAVAPLDAFAPPGERFDAVTLWDVIEHLPDPAAAMRNLVALLKPGGVLAVRTPNERSAFRRLAVLAWRLSLGLCPHFLKYVYYHPHFVTFTPRGLRRLAERCGLRPDGLRLESTPLRFAREKIRCSYSKHPGRYAVMAALPLAYAAGALLGRNKLVAYFRKEG